MKKFQSKFSNKKASGPKTSSSGCCCGSKFSDDIDEIDVIDVEEEK